MSDDILLTAEVRESSGTSASRGLRREGIIPGVVYNSKSEVASIQLDAHNFEQMLHHHKSEHLIVDLQVGKDKGRKVLLKEIQHHPVSGNVLHVDFLEIDMTAKMVFTINLEFKGEPVGVTTGGGLFEPLLRSIEVECLPTDLVESIAIDVTDLDIGASMLVRDLDIDSKFAVVTAEDVAVANVSAPKLETEPTEGEEGEAAEGAEGEAAAAPAEGEAAKEEPAEASD